MLHNRTIEEINIDDILAPTDHKCLSIEDVKSALPDTKPKYLKHSHAFVLMVVFNRIEYKSDI